MADAFCCIRHLHQALIQTSVIKRVLKRRFFTLCKLYGSKAIDLTTIFIAKPTMHYTL